MGETIISLLLQLRYSPNKLRQFKVQSGAQQHIFNNLYTTMERAFSSTRSRPLVKLQTMSPNLPTLLLLQSLKRVKVVLQTRKPSMLLS